MILREDSDHSIAMLKIGDIVSRINEDEHEVLAVNQAGDMIYVECIKPDSGGCFKVGDSEWNLTRRYELVRSVSATEPHCPKNES